MHRTYISRHAFACLSSMLLMAMSSPVFAQEVAAEAAESASTDSTSAEPEKSSGAEPASTSTDGPASEAAVPDSFGGDVPVWGQRSEPARLAVTNVNVQAEELDELVGESVSAVLAAELASISRGRYRVISRNDLKSIIGQQVEAQQMGCVDENCLVDIAKLASADFMVTSNIGKIGDEWVFTLELVDVARGQVIRRQATTWVGAPRGLVELCRPYVSRLVEGSKASDFKGAVQILANEEGAVVHLDEKAIGETPVELFPDLAIGRHRVQIKKDGFLLYKNDVVVFKNETTLLQAELVDESSLKPWYMKWWVWAGAAALVGGAVGTAVILAPEGTTDISPEIGLPSLSDSQSTGLTR